MTPGTSNGCEIASRSRLPRHSVSSRCESFASSASRSGRAPSLLCRAAPISLQYAPSDARSLPPPQPPPPPPLLPRVATASSVASVASREPIASKTQRSRTDLNVDT
eukprot:883907-Pleurochrysis_carterae.AAC.1